MTAALIIIIAIALIFDFVNGLHDAANSIATVVSTRVLSPKAAVIWAAFFNFIAYLIFDLKVANTIGKGTVVPEVIDQWVILGALVGAIVWDIVTWYFGIPSSSSHALIGGLSGAAVAKAGFSSLIPAGLTKIAIFIVLSPLVGMVLAYFFMVLLLWTFRKFSPHRVDRIFRKGQLVSAALYSLGHGGNDAQKTMGIIAVLLFTAGQLGDTFYVPFWVVISCHAAMGLGTLCGGWRIVKTMGTHLTQLKTHGGFCAETAGAVALFGATSLGIPVSTTHTITGAIAGVGSVNRFSAVRWWVAKRIVWAWILTIPASALIAAATWWLLRVTFIAT